MPWSVQHLASGEALGLPVFLNYGKLSQEPSRPFLPRPRLLQLRRGGACKAQPADVVTGFPEEVASVLFRFLRQQGIL